MKNDKFSVSIKGVLEDNDKILLRKNERNEYELLGGRLEKDDISAQQRLITEFSEESGISINVEGHLEPWLYEIGYSNIIIVPYKCKPISIPEELVDEDGGTIEWIHKSELDSLFMPQGYKDTIKEDVPHKSYSIPAKKYFKIIPNYVERLYSVFIHVYDDNNLIYNERLEHFNSPRDLISKLISQDYGNKDYFINAEEIKIDRQNDAIILNYRVNF